MAISENNSENKKRRGRPKSLKAQLADSLGTLSIEGCQRTKMNVAYSVTFMDAVVNGDPDDFISVMGRTKQEMERGGQFPTGYKTAALEIGRYIEAADADKKGIVREVADARRSGISFTKIAAHFRRLRLGSKKGNVNSLAKAIVRTINDYIRRFPDTSDAQIREAIQRVKVED